MTHNCDSNEQAPQGHSLCGRKLTYPPEIDEQLVKWVKHEQNNGNILSPDMLRREALRMIQPYCYEFKASTGWLDKFLSRNKISLQPNSAARINTDSPKGSPVPDNSQESIAVNKTAPPEAEEMQSSLSPRTDQQKQDIDDMDDDDEDDDESDSIKKDDDSDLKPANPERLKAFNMFVRLFIDENLDRLIPISKQPKEKINAIIMSCQRQFPEFSDRARKRIRTYLKSCRRSTRLREPTTKPSMQHIPSSQLTEVNNILAEACHNETLEVAKRQRLETVEVIPTNLSPQLIEASQNRPAIKACELQNTVLSSSRFQRGTDPSAHPSFIASTLKAPLMKLSQSEVTSMRNLIDGYRQSASFLHRSADELERLLKQCEAYSDESNEGEKIQVEEGDKIEGQEIEVKLNVPISDNKNEISLDQTLKSKTTSECEGTSINTDMASSTATSTSLGDRMELCDKPIAVSSNIIDSKICVLQHAPELLPLRVCEAPQHGSLRYISPVSFPLSTARVHPSVNYSVTSPKLRETSASIYQSHLLKPNEKGGIIYKAHLHQQNESGNSSSSSSTIYKETIHKHNEGRVNHYQTLAPKHTENTVTQYTLHSGKKKILVHHTPLIQIASHPSQNPSVHLSPQPQSQKNHNNPTLASHVVSQQSNAHSSLVYSFRTNQSQNRTSSQQSKQGHLHPDVIHYSTTHHQGTLNFENPQQVKDSRPQIRQQKLSPAMNYHTVLSPATSSQLQEISRQSHIQDANHQSQLLDIGRPSHSEYQHGHNIYDAHQTR